MKYLRRFLWFIASRLLVLVLVASLLVVSFYYAMNLTNIQVVIKDGMARRAQVVMMGQDTGELSKYFQQSFIEHDAALIAAAQGTSPYKDYNIRGIDHRIELSFFWLWPLEETVKVELVERIPSIDGRAKGSRAEELVAQLGPDAVYPPAWQSARYRATLVKEEAQWRIRSLTLLEALSE